MVLAHAGELVLIIPLSNKNQEAEEDQKKITEFRILREGLKKVMKFPHFLLTLPLSLLK